MDASFIATRSISHLGHLPGVSLITSGCMVQVYFTAAKVFDVSGVNVEAVESFLFSEELSLLQAAKTLAVKNMPAMTVLFMCIDFY